MTDNQTTELTATDRLRAMLDERGVDWTQGMAWNVTVINGDWLIVEDVDFGTLSVSTTAYQLTPEQAIAATLGSGTLTVKQVREAIYKNIGANPYNVEYYTSIIDHKAIADELNTELRKAVER